MIDMQFNAQRNCRAGATCAALEAVPLEHAPAETKRWVAACSVPVLHYNPSILFREFGANSIGVLDEGPKCLHPRAKATIVWPLRDVRWNRGQIASPWLTAKVQPNSQKILE